MQSSNLLSHSMRGKTLEIRHGRIASGTSRSSSRFAPANSRAIVNNGSFPKPNYNRLILAVIGLFILASAAVPLYSNSAAMVEQSAIARIDGGLVNILRADSGVIEGLDDGSQVSIQVNDMVRAESGTATVQFFSDQLVSLYPSSHLTVERYEVNDLGKRLEYMVWGGHILHESRQSTGASDWIQISTPSSNASIRNAVVSVQVISPSQTLYKVKEGVAWITMGDDEIFLAPNEELVAVAEQPLIKQGMSQFTNSSDSAANSEVASANVFAMGATSVAQHSSAKGPKTIGDLLTTNAQPEAAEQRIALNPEWQLRIVQPGDSFWTIASEHAISIDALVNANPEITNQSILPVGLTVRIPIDVK